MFIAFLGLSFTNLITYFRMLKEVNEQRDRTEQIGYLWFGPRKYWQVVRLHRRFYPSSRLRILNLAPVAIWFFLIATEVLYFR